MSTFVYGDRDFKGNVVQNASMQIFANKAALDLFTPPQVTHSGQQAWVTDEAKPYWWDGTQWVTLSGGWPTPVTPYYGVRAHTIPYQAVLPGPDGYHIGDTMTSYDILMLDADFFNPIPYINTDHPLTITTELFWGFTVHDGATGVTNELYNKQGPIRVYTVLYDKLPSVMQTPDLMGYWLNGNQQARDTAPTAGILNPIAPTVNTPFFSTTTQNGELVDSHITHAQGSELVVTLWDGSAYVDVAKFWFTYDATGLTMHVTSNATLATPALLGYVNTPHPDIWIGFNGIPRGLFLTYWF